MTPKSCESGWSIDPDLADIDGADFDEPTRIAPAELPDLKTVVEAGECAGARADETRAARSVERKNACALRQTAEFHPRSGMRATGDVTTQWAADEINAAAIVKTCFSRVLESLRGHGRLIVLATLAALAAAIMLATIVRSKGGGFVRDRRPPVTATTSSNANSAAAPTRKTPARRSENNEWKEAPGKPGASLKNAADALIDGHLEDALAIYKDLLAASPGNESFGLAVEILSNSNEGEHR